MPKEMLINVSAGEECRIALLNDGRLEELYMERTSSTSHVGNIYKGRVTNVEPSIQAAFVDFGLGRNGFLHISDLMPTYFGRQGEDIHESVGRKMARRDRPPIQRCLRRGDEIIVQIIKEGIGTKGPTLSTYLSIPGKMLVMMPGMGKMGVSKKIEDDQERRRLRQILDSLKPPRDVAFIIRTAGVGKTKLEIERDLKYLTRLWETIKKKEQEPGPVELYTEGDLVTRTVRDLFSADVERIVVDDQQVCQRVKEVIKISSPRAKNRCDLYDDPVPLFHRAGIEQEIEMMYSRHVPLPSGGSLVIDSTEAVVAIDVNSGKNRENNDAEMTAFKVDMEAADEIPRQLKLRDLGGVIICDFIDLRYERHRRELEERLFENFKNDRAKTKVLRMSQFGIIEITRQRMRPSLKRSIYFDCPHCKGAGLIKTPESISLDVMRKLAIALNDQRVVRTELSVCPDVAFYLLNKKREALTDLEKVTKKKILIRTDNSLGLDELKFALFDIRDGVVILEEIGMTLPDRAHTSQLGVHPPGHTHQNRGGRQGGQRGDNRGRNNRRNEYRPVPTRAAEDDREEMDEDRLAIERGEDVEDREDQDGFIEPAPQREEDPTDIPAILETQHSDEVEEFSDEDEDEVGEDSGQTIDRNLPARPQLPRQDNRPPQNRPQNQYSNRPQQAGRGNHGRPDQNRSDQNRSDQNRPDQNRGARPDQGRQGPGGQNQQRTPQGQNFNRGPETGGPPEESQGGGRRRRRRGRRGRGRGNQSGAFNGEPTGREPNGNVGPEGYDDNRPLQPPAVANEFHDHDYNADPEAPFTGEITTADSGSEFAPGEGAPPVEGAIGGETKPRRRRRRGGRRHRRRGQGNDIGGLNNQSGVGQPDEFGNDELNNANADTGEFDNEMPPVEPAAPEPVEEIVIPEPVQAVPEVEAQSPVKPKAKRSRAPARSRAAAPKRVPPKKTSKKNAEPAPEVTIAAEVVRTGSADKHLVSDDEPVAPQPLPRPRSYRDLDAIPDDYD